MSADPNPRELAREAAFAKSQAEKRAVAMQGVNTGDYTGASRDTPMLYGNNTNYERTLGSGSVDTSATPDADGNRPSSKKGYAVYDSFTDEEGNQYVAVAGKNSSFIEKISADGTVERIAKPPRKKGKRNTNIKRVLGEFERLKANVATADDTSTPTTTDDDDDTSTNTNTTTDNNTSSGTTSLTAEDYTQTVDPAVAGGAFQSVTPPTTMQQVPAGGIPIVDPDESQYVTQQVSPVTYQNTLGTAGSGPGTVTTPTQTGGTSAVPGQVTYKTQYTGTQGAVPQTLVTTQPGTGATYPEVYQGYQTVPYGNNLGQVIMITEFNGVPTTYVPPGFSKLTGEAQATQQQNIKQQGDPNDPKSAISAAEGGYIKGFQEGGDTTQPVNMTSAELAEMQKRAVQQTMQPMQATTAMIQPTAADFIPVDAGMTVPIAPFAEAATVGNVQQAALPTTPATNTAGVTTVAPQVAKEAAKLQAATGEPTKEITAQQQIGTSITGMEAAQGNAIKVDSPTARKLETDPVSGESEIISGAANAQTAAAFTEAVEAAEATPSKQATVAGQLEKLMADFEGGETPAWAAGSMRTAMATLAARGLGASSLAGQAVIQAAMEAALPIAQMDAATVAQFEMTNLSNRQQRQMLAAQQRATFMGMEFDQEFQSRVANSARIGDIANMNFTAEQQIALEDSRAANTMELSNLSNSQAMIMAEAAALSQLDMANLSNRQQAAVQNASNFLQMDMANLSNEQQTAIFKTQQNIQAMFTDQAAENAAAQFNATSENQTDQFFANLANQTSQFNATQQNAMDQFNVNSVNALREFNSELQQQRDIFNAQNGLVIAQSNAAWRQSIATVNTATQNQSNMDFAKTINALTASNMDQIWQRERDIMSFAFAASESAADRANSIAVAKLTADAQAEVADNVGKGKLAAIAIDAVLGKWL